MVKCTERNEDHLIECNISAGYENPSNHVIIIYSYAIFQCLNIFPNHFDFFHIFPTLYVCFSRGDGGCWAVELSLVWSGADHCWAKQVFQKIIIAFMVFLSFLQRFLCLYDWSDEVLVFVRCIFGTKLLLVFCKYYLFFRVRVWENFARPNNLMR